MVLNITPKGGQKPTTTSTNGVSATEAATRERTPAITEPAASDTTDQQPTAAVETAEQQDTTAETEGPRRRTRSRSRRTSTAKSEPKDTPAEEAAPDEVGEASVVQAIEAAAAKPIEPEPTTDEPEAKADDKDAEAEEPKTTRKRTSRSRTSRSKTAEAKAEAEADDAKAEPEPEAKPARAAAKKSSTTEPTGDSVLDAIAAQSALIERQVALAEQQVKLLEQLNRTVDRQHGLLEQQSRRLEGTSKQLETLGQTVETALRSGGSSGEKRLRAGVFVDVANVELAAERFRDRIDWKKVLNLLTKNRELVRAVAYAPVHGDLDVSIESQRFVEPFLDSQYKIVTKPLKKFQDGTVKANVDIEMAVDILGMLDQLDVVCLVSGDGDFKPLVDVCQARGIRVEVVGVGPTVARQLRDAADGFIDLQERLRELRK